MRVQRSKRGGSVIVMVTLAILLLFAVIGLVVDLGWASFARRTAQVAADAAVQAAAKRALELGQADGTFDLLKAGAYDAELEDRARAYATLNGFTTDGDNTRQKVTITMGPGPYPGTGGISNLDIIYWVEASVTTRLSSLFIGASGAGGELTSGANAVAAVINAIVPGSIILLNQTCAPDGTACSPDVVPGIANGVNLFLQGSGSSLTTGGGIMMNSSANGDSRTKGNYAAQRSGNPVVKGSYVQIAQDGNFKGQAEPGMTFQNPSGAPLTPVNGPQVEDPTFSMNLGKQPRVKTVAETVAATPGNIVYGVTGALGGGSTVLGPGVYAAVTMTPSGPVLTGDPIRITGNLTFQNPDGNPGSYIFVGGLEIKAVNVSLDQGVYVAAGTKTGTVLDIAANAKIIDNGGGTYGEMVLLTRPDYVPDSQRPVTPDNPILLDPAASYLIQPISFDGAPLGAPAVRPFASVADPNVLAFGEVNIQAGSTDKADVNMTGLKGRSSDGFDDGLLPYQPVVMWQDRRNNALNPALTGANKNKHTIHSQASALKGLLGTIYQPRGSLLEMQGGGTHNAQAQIITGAVSISGNPNITLPTVTVPTVVTIVSLVR